jgi:hypothetical protein
LTISPVAAVAIADLVVASADEDSAGAIVVAQGVVVDGDGVDGVAAAPTRTVAAATFAPVASAIARTNAAPCGSRSAIINALPSPAAGSKAG